MYQPKKNKHSLPVVDTIDLCVVVKVWLDAVQ